MEDSGNLRRSSRRVSPKNYRMPKYSEILRENGANDDSSEESASDDGGQQSASPNSPLPEPAQPQLLFNEDEDVQGQDIFTFRTPKKRNPLAVESTKTPKHIRRKVKKAIREAISSDEDFSGDEDNYKTESESEDTEEEEGSDESATESHPPEEKPRKIPLTKCLSGFNTPKPVKRGSKARGTTQCLIESDKYFQTYSKKGSVTSNHTLDRLGPNQMPPEELLKGLTIGSMHQEFTETAFQDHQRYFQKWLMVLSEGFNVLLYGVGSKRRLINSFHRHLAKTHPVITVNGFFPGLTIQDILSGITNNILIIPNMPSGPQEAVAIIERKLPEMKNIHVFLLIHNIDGPNLRVPKAQEILARLVRVPNIHLVASVDHINAPLLWDHSKLSSYNFMWFDVTTMEPYTAETTFESSLIAKNSGELVLSSMRNVFHSLTTNSKAIYRLIIQHQLDNKTNANYQGISFKELYTSSRDSFLVSSDIALRAQLTEFTDHKMCRLRRTADGMEHLTVPIDNHLLEQFLTEHQV